MRFKILLLALLFPAFGLTNALAQQGDGGAPAGEIPRTISGGVVNGKATNLVKPAYPAAARAVNASGAVNVQVTIDEEGSVIAANAVSGHPLLRAAAVEAARASKFSPTRLSGQPVRVTGIIVYNFTLPAKTETSESDQLIAMGMAMFLSAMKELPGDEETDQIMLEMGNEMPPAMKVEKSRFERLVNARSQSEKARITDEIIAAMRKNLTGTQAWMIDLGAHWGGAIGEAFKISDSEFRRDRQNFIKNLQSMNWLLETPPKDVSEESLNKIRAVAAYNNETDSITPQFIESFFKSSLAFMDHIISEGKK